MERALLDKTFVILALGALYGCTATAHTDIGQSNAVSPEKWAEQCEPWDDWDKPAGPYKMHGNTYYVGTCGISAILVVDEEGLILIDSGTKAGAKVVTQNISALGFSLTNVKIILHSHEHHDHVGGFSWIKEMTGARVIASKEAAKVLRSGIASAQDPQSGMHEAMDPVEVDTVIEISDYVLAGRSVILTAIETPGHTPGALSWTWRSCEDAICLKFVYADSLSPISKEGYRFSDHPEYVAAFRKGLSNLASTECDVLLTPHPSSSDMLKRLRGPQGLFSPGMCKEYAMNIEKRLEARLAKEKASE
ncbi:MAG: subclass B3 metallo-beta-lactamase [Pseudomonadota bacterium]